MEKQYSYNEILKLAKEKFESAKGEFEACGLVSRLVARNAGSAFTLLELLDEIKAYKLLQEYQEEYRKWVRLDKERRK